MVQHNTDYIKKLIDEANKLEEMGTFKANDVVITKEFIQQQADEMGVSFDEMVEILKHQLTYF
jgi:uncharacterized protein YjgD (DUF1641 family)